MRAIYWLVPLLLLAPQVARAQQTPETAKPNRDAAISAVPSPAPIAQPAASGAPADVAHGAASLTAAPVPPMPPPGVAQGFYVPRPPPPGTFMLPAYPGPAPQLFSALQVVDYGTWRLEMLLARERGLIRAGVPSSYRAQRVGGFMLVGLGTGIALVSSYAAALMSATGPNSDDDELKRAQRGAGLAAIAGLAMAIGGGVWVYRVKRNNIHADEIAGLHEERRVWREQVERAREAVPYALSISVSPTRLQVQF